MTQHLVVCEREHDCTNETCGYRTPTEGGTMQEAMCGHVGYRVNIIEYYEVSTSDPNYIFKRKKNGL